jgi:hypothetical protein
MRIIFLGIGIATFFTFPIHALAAWSIIPDSMLYKFQQGLFDMNDIPIFILHLIELSVTIGGGVYIIMNILAGMRYIIGSMQGEKENGKNALLNALIGFVLIILSWVLVDIFITFLQ